MSSKTKAFNDWAGERFDDIGVLRFSNDGKSFILCTYLTAHACRPLEYAVRWPIKNFNWHLVRRLKLSNLKFKSVRLPEADRALFLAKGEALLDIEEERKTMVMYIEELKSTQRWFGLKFHFRNLIVEDEAMEEGVISTTCTSPLRWLHMQGEAPPSISTPSASEQPSAPADTITTILDQPESSTTAHCTSDGPSEDAKDDSIIPFAAGSMVNFQGNAFRPSWAINGARPPTNPTIAQLAVNIGVGIEPNYEGEVTGAHLLDRACPDAMNTAVYLKYVNPASTAKDIFDYVREGGIFKYSRQEPTGSHTTAAVTLTFKHRQAAQRFVFRTQTQGFQIRGWNVQVMPSLNPSWGIEPGRAHQTRVLEVVAPAADLDADSLEAEFHNNIRFNLVKRDEWTEDGYKTIHFHFESIHAQSRAAAMYLSRTNTIRGLLYQFVEDPCAIDGS